MVRESREETGVKILIISQYWAPENGVPQRRWSWLTRILLEAGHDVRVLAPPPHYLRKQTFREWVRSRVDRVKNAVDTGPAGETIYRSGYFPGGMSITQKVINQASVALGAMRMVVRRNGRIQVFAPDVIIGTVPALPTAVVTYVTSKRLHAPYIIDLRDAWPELLEYSDQWNVATGGVSFRQKVFSKGPLQLVSSLTHHVLHFVYKRAAAIIVTAEDLAEQLRTDDVEAPPVETVRNVFPAETDIRRRHETEKDSLRVLYAGTLGRAQNLKNALHAAQLVRDQGVDIKLRFVGAGAARDELEKAAQQMGLDAEFVHRRSSNDLAEHYLWADTALVHLTDWEPLRRAVPSKTYELIGQKIHISGVVAGETARLISRLEVGDVVPPEQPEKLADLWCELARHPERLSVGDKGAAWLEKEREENAPAVFLHSVERAAECSK